MRGLSIEGYSGGMPVFSWSTFDHLAVDDAAPDISITGTSVNPWHGNAIELDTDGHLLVSFRNMDEVTKIHRQTGEVLWRLGGKRNQFTFIGDPLEISIHLPSAGQSSTSSMR